MSLRTYLAILWRRKWIIVLTTILTTILATVASLVATPIYRSSATLRVATIGSGGIEYIRPDINYTERLMNTYANIITGSGVRNDIMRQFNLEDLPSISVEMIPDTELIKINTEATSPRIARDVTNEVAEILITQSKELYAGGGQTTQEILSKQIAQIEEELVEARSDYEELLLDSPDDSVAIVAASQSIELKERTYAYLLEQYEGARVNEALRANAVTVVEPAYAPRLPAKPRLELNIVLGVMVGFMGGIGLALLFDNLDRTLYSSEEIEAATQLSTIGIIPKSKKQLGLVDHDQELQPQLEAFKRLRTNILTSARGDEPRIILVTSAERGEGKSTIVSNLAVVIAQSGRRVMVVDCDLRLPAIHKIFGLPNKRGLTNVLIGKMQLSQVVNRTDFPRLHVISSGTLPPNPSELLGSPEMENLIGQMRKHLNIVLLDSPAMLSVTDAAVLVPYVDDVILVVAQAHVQQDSVQTACQQLTNVQAKSINIVVNLAKPHDSYGYYNYDIRSTDGKRKIEAL